MKRVQKNKNKKNHTMFPCKHDWHKKNIDAKKNINLKKKLFKKYQDFIWLFEFKKTNKLFSFKKSKINHFIKLKKINDEISLISWKSLYNMFYNELLILRKILNDYLNKKFIKISNSSTASFILFVCVTVVQGRLKLKL